MSIIPYRESQPHTYVESKYKNMLPPPLVNDIEIRGKRLLNKEISSFHDSCLITILETSNPMASLKRHGVWYH